MERFKSVKLYTKELQTLVTPGSGMEPISIVFSANDFGGNSIPNKLRVNNLAICATVESDGDYLGAINYKNAGVKIKLQPGSEAHAIQVNQTPVINLQDPFIGFELPPFNLAVECPYIFLREEVENYTLNVTITLYVEL